MAGRFSNVDDCFCFSFTLSSRSLTPGMWVYFRVTIKRLYNWEKWLYYINICINKTLYVINRDTLCAPLLLFVFLVLTITFEIKNNSSQTPFVRLYVLDVFYLLIFFFFSRSLNCGGL